MRFPQPSTYLLIAVALLVAFGVWRMLRDDCEQQCSVAVQEAQKLGEDGAVEDGLVMLDAVDAKCGCARGYEGDAPPADSTMRALLSKLMEQGDAEANARVTKEAKGPLLKEALAR